jgi:hypothetical protein
VLVLRLEKVLALFKLMVCCIFLEGKEKLFWKQIFFLMIYTKLRF